MSCFRLFLCCVALFAAPLSLWAAPDSWSIRMVDELEFAKASKLAAITLDQAETLLDYRQYRLVAEAMRFRLEKNRRDARAWSIYARALTALGHAEAAEQAMDNFKILNADKRTWQLSMKLGTFVDSNVLIAPSALNLAASDQGDIGAKVTLALAGKVLSSGYGDTSAWLRYDDMLYQDLNSYALRSFQAGVMQSMDMGSGVGVRAGLALESSSLGNTPFYSGFQLLAGADRELNSLWHVTVDALLGRRNFSSDFNDFSAWRGYLHSALQAEKEDWVASVRLSIGVENTRRAEEAYRELGLLFSGEHKFISLFDDDTWLLASLDLKQMTYQNLDSRPFLRAAMTRRDSQLSANVKWQWQRDESLWGGNSGEVWYLSVDWKNSRSNMDETAVFDAAQSRAWRYWQSELGVVWKY